MKFIHCADIHLDSPLKGLERHEGAPVEEIRNASRQAFATLVSLCLEERVDFLLIAGDLFDGAWRDFNTALWFVKQANRLRDADIPVFLARGNHDAQSRFIRHVPLPANVTEFPAAKPATITLEPLRVAIHGHSFAKPAETANLAARYPPPVPGCYNIGLLHTALDGRPGHAPYAPCRKEDLLNKGYDYWALGHVHQWEIVHPGGPWILFPGMPQGRHVRETGAKGCALVTVEDGGATTVAFRAVDTLRWSAARVDLTGCARIEGAMERIREQLSSEVRGADGRIVAVRLLIEGAEPLRDAMARRGGEWLDAVRAQALEIPGGPVWVERVFFTSFPLPVDVPAEIDATGLEAICRELADDPEALAMLAGEAWDDLRAFLPSAVSEGEDGLRFDDPAWRLEVLRQARELALRGLRAGGAG
ncbi:MAG: DNA repair exonuclease [Magnetococcales bacterium]|nr:DNA repair exonuclease [Magnetococcales bacterium]